MDVGRKPITQYGSLEETIRQIRAHRPLDLGSDAWRKANPEGTFARWRRQARDCLRRGLHYDPGPLDLKPKVLERTETDTYIRERIEFNTAPWFRVPGYFYTPRNVDLPAPALVVFHEWGGPMLFGADRVCGEPACHPVVAEHRKTYKGGRALADWYASQGYCVIAIDAYHFGRRAPQGIGGLPARYDIDRLTLGEIHEYQRILGERLYIGVRQLNWAGTTWCGINYHDDSRCVDYLLSRREVDPKRIGCTGLSGGGWRTNILAALEDRIAAAVGVGWMTTGDAQQAYNVEGAIGTFCLLPGVWDRIDIPDLIAMAAPKACMVVSGTKDPLFPPKGQRDAHRQIRRAYSWAGHPERYRGYMPDKPHCYDVDIQREALKWFDRHLKE